MPAAHRQADRPPRLGDQVGHLQLAEADAQAAMKKGPHEGSVENEQVNLESRREKE